MNNIIMVGENKFRYQNLIKFSNGDLIFETSPYMYSNRERNFLWTEKEWKIFF